MKCLKKNWKLSNLRSNKSINQPITLEEVTKCIRSLKNNKSCGYDGIVREHITSTGNVMSIFRSYCSIKFLIQGSYLPNGQLVILFQCIKTKAIAENPKMIDLLVSSTVCVNFSPQS